MNTIIHQFISTVRERLNQARLVRVVSICLLVVSITLCAWCIWWVIQGYSVPRSGYLAAALALPCIAALAWLFGRTSIQKAARTADEHFDLKDSISSYLGFSRDGRQGGFITLQAEATAARVASLSAASIPIVWPRRVLGAAAILLLACLLMAFRKPTPSVIERIAIENDTAIKTDAINRDLEEVVEDLINSASDEEKELIEPDEWRKWVNELRETRNPEEAMRQYARLEQRVAGNAQKTEDRDTEQLLSKAAQELSQSAELRPVSKSLSEQNYRKAAGQLHQLRLKADTHRRDESERELARLKSAAQRMADAARSHQQRTGRSSIPGQESASNPMSSQMVGLEQALQKLQQALRQQNPDQSQCQSCQKEANQALDKLCQSLCQAAARKEHQKKLMSLCQSLAECQNCIGDQGVQSPFVKPGGRQPGGASVASRREESDLGSRSVNPQQLQGIRGTGPGETSIESADSGTGRATQVSEVKEKVWQRQMESFIQREDVPEEIKTGVKEYFKGIQQVGTEK